jgi:hypothetical protein
MSLNARVRKKAPAGCLIPFGFLFLAIGLAVCWFSWTRILAEVRKVHSWIETPCRVTTWKIEVTSEGENYKVTPSIAYEYDFNGQHFTGKTYDAAMSSSPAINEFEEQGAKAGSQGAVCYVNPANPQESSFLRASFTVGGFVLGMGLVFAGVGGSIILGGLFSILRRIIGNQAPAGGATKGCLGTILTPIFCLIFAGAGFLVWKLALAGEPDWKAIGARMVPVPATVIASGVETHRSSGKNRSTSYKTRLAYQYDFGGRQWHSAWLDFDRGNIGNNNYQKARAAADRYPKGAGTTAWVDPEAPWRAVLEKNASSRWWLWLFPILFGGIGIIGFLVWLLKLTALGAALFGTKRIGGS